MSTPSPFTSAIGGASPSNERLRAWPSLTEAAALLGVTLSTLSRAMDARAIEKHRLGGRGRKIAPVSVLDLAVAYGADVAHVADDVLRIAEESGAPARFVAGVEDDMGAWFEGQARSATLPGSGDDDLARLIAAVHDVLDEDEAAAVLARAQLTGRDAAPAATSPSSRRR